MLHLCPKGKDRKRDRTQFLALFFFLLFLLAVHWDNSLPFSVLFFSLLLSFFFLVFLFFLHTTFFFTSFFFFLSFSFSLSLPLLFSLPLFPFVFLSLLVHPIPHLFLISPSTSFLFLSFPSLPFPPLLAASFAHRPAQPSIPVYKEKKEHRHHGPECRHRHGL